jgi:predicted nucleic acid-binding protein
MIVVDASAIVEFLAPDVPNEKLGRRLVTDADLHAPHLLDVEVANALRRLTSRGKLGADRAADALLDADAIPIERYPHSPLLQRAWELRHVLTIPDAVYVSLAEILGAPLVTCDARLSGAPCIQAEIELYPRAG